MILIYGAQSGGCADWWRVRRIGGGVATDPMHTERRDWFGSATGLGGRRKLDRALAEGWEGVGEKTHPSISLRAGFLAKNARNGVPGL
jgi:hypothetical protein